MLRNWRQFLFDPNEPAAVTPPPEPTPAPPPATPWAADAEAYGLDPAAFDRYQREKAQPYITKLETDSAEAREYYKDLQENTDDTLRALIGQRYGDEFAAEFDALFGEPDPEPTPPPAADEVPEWAKPLVDHHQAQRDAELVAQRAAEYATFKEGLKTSHGLTDDDLAIIDPFIAAAPDSESGIAAYKTWHAKAYPAKPAADVPTPPPVLGTDGVAATPPLATKYTRYDQIGDALKAHLSQQAVASNPPPVVG